MPVLIYQGKRVCHMAWLRCSCQLQWLQSWSCLHVACRLDKSHMQVAWTSHSASSAPYPCCLLILAAVKRSKLLLNRAHVVPQFLQQFSIACGIKEAPFYIWIEHRSIRHFYPHVALLSLIDQRGMWRHCHGGTTIYFCMNLRIHCHNFIRCFKLWTWGDSGHACHGKGVKKHEVLSVNVHESCLGRSKRVS